MQLSENNGLISMRPDGFPRGTPDALRGCKDRRYIPPRRRETMSRPRRKEECRLQLLQVIRQLPEIRQERVDELKNCIDQGSYKIDVDALADRMLEETLTETLQRLRKPRH